MTALTAACVCLCLCVRGNKERNWLVKVIGDKHHLLFHLTYHNLKGNKETTTVMLLMQLLLHYTLLLL